MGNIHCTGGYEMITIKSRVDLPPPWNAEQEYPPPSPGQIPVNTPNPWFHNLNLLTWQNKAEEGCLSGSSSECKDDDICSRRKYSTQGLTREYCSHIGRRELASYTQDTTLIQILYLDYLLCNMPRIPPPHVKKRNIPWLSIVTQPRMV